ncbi:MAG: hypothetical protein MK135_06130 [Polyangiaceae bacterium]|nr:hypothetical protein [Polyangiaceae bacterium]
MRSKIILVNGGIILVLSLLTFFLLKTSIAATISDPSEVRKDLLRVTQAARSQVALDSMRSLRWASEQAQLQSASAVFTAGTKEARQEAATEEANHVIERAALQEELRGISPTMALFINQQGVVMGRNGSQLMRGENLLDYYPKIRATLTDGRVFTDSWVNQARDEQFLAAYAPVRRAGEVVGALVIGTPINDALLTRASDLTSGQSVAVFISSEELPLAVGGAPLNGFRASAVIDAVHDAEAGQTSYASTAVDGRQFVALPLHGYGEGAVLVGTYPVSPLPGLNGLLWPVFAVGLLGVILVGAGGIFLGNYISRPVEDLEEGLLMVMNGQHDIRFELEHDELGGLVSRLNGLLSSLFDDDHPED